MLLEVYVWFSILDAVFPLSQKWNGMKGSSNHWNLNGATLELILPSAKWKRLSNTCD